VKEISRPRLAFAKFLPHWLKAKVTRETGEGERETETNEDLDIIDKVAEGGTEILKLALQEEDKELKLAACTTLLALAESKGMRKEEGGRRGKDAERRKKMRERESGGEKMQIWEGGRKEG
jgi:hypothetical protein